MNKGERISRLVAELGENVDLTQIEVARHPFYRAFFQRWNEQRYYEAHDVLENLWLKQSQGEQIFSKVLSRRQALSFIFKSASNIQRTQNTASVCLLRCVCS